MSPYDAELFGHWWYEGPMFIEMLIRKAAYDQDVLTMASPIDYLSEFPEQQVAQPPFSSWGAGGYAGVWLDKRLGSTPWFTLIGVFVGAAGGFYSMYRKITASQRREVEQQAKRRSGPPA